MFKNYIKIAFRNIIKHKVYSLINILGFALGISCFLLITFYVLDEFSYDTFHSKADRIYRVAEKYTQSGEVQLIANSSAPWGPAMADDFPEVLNTVRLMPPVTQYAVSNPRKNLHFFEKRFVFSDPSVFDIFDFELIEGDSQTALSKPGQLVLTESTARKYFGQEDPLGKTLILDKMYPFRITGIARDVPHHSHLKFDFLASLITLQNRGMRHYAPAMNFFLDRRGTFYTYILLQDGASPVSLEQKFPEFMQKHAGELYKRLKTLNTLDPFLQPLKSIHLRSHLEREWEPNSYIQHVYIFGAVALFVLLIACFNFMNLSTARASLRAQEVGLRKVVGAERPQLIRQFISESIFLTALSTILALGMARLFLPLLNRLTDKAISIDFLSDWWLLPGILLLILIVGLISGSYPAFLISSFQPVRVLKGQLIGSLSGNAIRRILTVVQFSISIGLIVGLSVVSGQMSFIRGKELGYDKENVLILPLSYTKEGQDYRPYKEAILSHPRVEAASASHTLMGKPPVTREVRPAGAGDEANMSFRQVEADVDFLRVYKMKILEGRDFSVEKGDEKLGTIIINRETAKGLGLESPVGQTIHLIKPLHPRRIVGVVDEFHLESLHEPIQPVIISLGRTEPYLHLSIRISPDDIQGTVGFLRDKWREVFPGTPFQYTFFESEYEDLYRSEERLNRLFFYFTVIALIIACMGLFGLASFMTERRTKEIGIRKVIGAGVLRIVGILVKDFALLILYANIIAWPVAYIFMFNWLQDFAYRIPLNVWTFVSAGLLGLVIAMLTVSYQTIRAALANPIDSLRYE